MEDIIEINSMFKNTRYLKNMEENMFFTILKCTTCGKKMINGQKHTWRKFDCNHCDKVKRRECKWCNKKITHPVKHDWASRGYHKKCWNSFCDYTVWKLRNQSISQ
jgi:hypothetical protein